MAILYNDRSVLENHHVSAAYRLMQDDEMNILVNLSKDDWRYAGVCSCEEWGVRSGKVHVLWVVLCFPQGAAYAGDRDGHEHRYVLPFPADQDDEERAAAAGGVSVASVVFWECVNTARLLMNDCDECPPNGNVSYILRSTL